MHPCFLFLLVYGGQVPEKPLPSCGATAAYCYLRASGVDVPLSTVERTLNASHQGASILDVRQALASHGCQTDAITCRPDRIHQLPLPAILYFDIGRWPYSGQQGHYVMVHKIDDHQITLLDWQSPEPYSVIPTSTLVKMWDGVAIVPHTSPYLRQIMTFIAFGVASWLAWPYGLMLKSWVLSRKRVAACLVMLFVVGCHKEPVARINRISVDTPVKQLGIVSGDGRVETVFRLSVSEGDPVTIVDTIRSCSCTLPDDKVIGVPLAGGSQHDLKVSITGEPLSGGEAIVRTLTLVTRPASATPITLAVRYRRLDPPHVSIDSMLVESPKGVQSEGAFQVTRYRRESDVAIWLDRERTDSGPFAIAAVESKTEHVPKGEGPDDHIVIDRTTVRLRARDLLDYGDHTSIMKLMFTDGTHKQIPTRIRVQHPFSPVLKRVSCGQCKAGETWKARVLVKIMPNLVVDSMLLQDLSGSAEIENKRWLKMEGVAPATPGPFSGKVIVSFQDKSLSAVELDLHGNVSE